MIVFIESFFISSFCFLFFQNTSQSIFAAVYFVVFLSIRLWLEIIGTDKLKKLVFIISIILAIILKPNAILFLAVLITVNFENENKYFKWTLIPLICILINTTLLFSCFSALIFFYSWIKENYFFIKLKSLNLQDKLNKNNLEIKKQKIILENENLKNMEASILAERNRISSELHNSIGHSLSSAILQVNAMKYLTHEEEVKKNLEVLQHSLESGMQEIRECLHNITKESLDLENSLQEFIQTIPDIKINLKIKVDSLPYSLKHDIISIIKESIANILKHAKASEVKITILEQSKFYSIVIVDDGIGCDINKIKKQEPGIGLMVLKEIVEKNSGNLNFYANIPNSNIGFKTHIIIPKK